MALPPPTIDKLVWFESIFIKNDLDWTGFFVVHKRKELQMSEEKMNIGSAEGDQVLELDINRLRDFKNHPFKVTADMSMVELKDSIERYGMAKM